MKTKRTMARSTKALFVLLTAIALLAAFAVPALADNVGKGTHLMYQMGDIQLTESQSAAHIADHLPDITEAIQAAEVEADPQSPSFPDAGSEEVVGPDEFEDPTFPDAGGDEVPGPAEFEPTFPDGGADEAYFPDDSTEATPSAEESETPPSQEDSDTPSSDNDDDPTLPFTGGNATPFAIAGLLIALAGAVVFIYKRRVFGR
jgi:LPXTG-motif cell wall-anchored protein